MDAKVASLFRGTPSRIETRFGGSNYGDGGSSGSGGSFGGVEGLATLRSAEVALMARRD